MKNDTITILLAVSSIIGAGYYISKGMTPSPAPAPPIVIPVNPAPAPTPDPERPRHPWRPLHPHEAKVGGDVAPDGAPVQVDMPQDKRMHNTGGSDGAGLCVFTSINHAAIWQGVDSLKDFQKWMKSKPGGGYPEKVDKMIAQKCGANKPRYVQVEGASLDVIDLACKTGRMACVTYGFSPSGRYGGHRISHMVNCVHAINGYYAILDNNYPEELEWDSKEEFTRAYGSDGGWTFVLLDSGPPPPPTNLRK